MARLKRFHGMAGLMLATSLVTSGLAGPEGRSLSGIDAGRPTKDVTERVPPERHSQCFWNGEAFEMYNQDDAFQSRFAHYYYNNLRTSCDYPARFWASFYSPPGNTYTDETNYYRGMVITYSFVPDEGPSDWPYDWRELFREAASTWEASTGIVLIEVEDDGAVDTTPLYKWFHDISPGQQFLPNQTPPRGDIRIALKRLYLPSDTLGTPWVGVPPHPTSFGNQGDILVPRVLSGGNEVGLLTPEQIQAIIDDRLYDSLRAHHEFGHALGLMHSNPPCIGTQNSCDDQGDPHFVMEPGAGDVLTHEWENQGYITLTQDDILGIQQLYGDPWELYGDGVAATAPVIDPSQNLTFSNGLYVYDAANDYMSGSIERPTNSNPAAFQSRNDYRRILSDSDARMTLTISSPSVASYGACYLSLELPLLENGASPAEIPCSKCDPETCDYYHVFDPKNVLDLGMELSVETSSRNVTTTKNNPSRGVSEHLASFPVRPEDDMLIRLLGTDIDPNIPSDLCWSLQQYNLNLGIRPNPQAPAVLRTGHPGPTLNWPIIPSTTTLTSLVAAGSPALARVSYDGLDAFQETMVFGGTSGLSSGYFASSKLANSAYSVVIPPGFSSSAVPGGTLLRQVLAFNAALGQKPVKMRQGSFGEEELPVIVNTEFKLPGETIGQTSSMGFLTMAGGVPAPVQAASSSGLAVTTVSVTASGSTSQAIVAFLAKDYANSNFPKQNVVLARTPSGANKFRAPMLPNATEHFYFLEIDPRNIAIADEAIARTSPDHVSSGVVGSLPMVVFVAKVKGETTGYEFDALFAYEDSRDPRFTPELECLHYSNDIGAISVTQTGHIAVADRGDLNLYLFSPKWSNPTRMTGFQKILLPGTTGVEYASLSIAAKDLVEGLASPKRAAQNVMVVAGLQGIGLPITSPKAMRRFSVSWDGTTQTILANNQNTLYTQQACTGDSDSIVLSDSGTATRSTFSSGTCLESITAVNNHTAAPVQTIWNEASQSTLGSLWPDAPAADASLAISDVDVLAAVRTQSRLGATTLPVATRNFPDELLSEQYLIEVTTTPKTLYFLVRTAFNAGHPERVRLLVEKSNQGMAVMIGKQELSTTDYSINPGELIIPRDNQLGNGGPACFNAGSAAGLSAYLTVEGTPQAPTYLLETLIHYGSQNSGTFRSSVLTAGIVLDANGRATLMGD